MTLEFFPELALLCVNDSCNVLVGNWDVQEQEEGPYQRLHQLIVTRSPRILVAPFPVKQLGTCRASALFQCFLIPLTFRVMWYIHWAFQLGEELYILCEAPGMAVDLCLSPLPL